MVSLVLSCQVPKFVYPFSHSFRDRVVEIKSKESKHNECSFCCKFKWFFSESELKEKKLKKPKPSTKKPSKSESVLQKYERIRELSEQMANFTSLQRKLQSKSSGETYSLPNKKSKSNKKSVFTDADFERIFN